MLPGNLYLADELIFQFRGLTRTIQLYSFIHKNIGSQNTECLGNLIFTHFT